MKRFALLFVFFMAVSAFADDKTSLARVELELPHSAVLPGVPFDMAVTIKNLSNRPIAVGKTATVIITPVNGKPDRILERASLLPGGAMDSSSNIELEPGEVRSASIAWSTSWFYNDAAFTVPGSYDLTLELTGDPEEPEPITVYVGTVRSSHVRLKRNVPTGDDAAVWERLQATDGGHWTSRGFSSSSEGQKLAQEVIDKYPASGYVPYAMILGHSTPYFHLTLARDAVERFRESPAYAHLVVAAGAIALSEAAKAEHRNATDAELESLYELALSYNEEALRTGNIAVKNQARMNRYDAKAHVEKLQHPRTQQP